MVVSSDPLGGRAWDVGRRKTPDVGDFLGVGLACYEEVKSNLERKCAFLRGMCVKGRQIVIICDVFYT